jgi:hypothetical protein
VSATARRGCAGAAVLAVLACAAPAVAAQAPRQAGGRSPFHSGFSLETHGGLRVSVLSLGESAIVGVSSDSGKGIKSETAYVARGSLRPERLRASFGHFGSLSMRFLPSPHRAWVKPHRRCRGGRRFRTRTGVWVGRFRFKGEGGYVSVDIHRARGQVSDIAPRCRRGSGARPLARAVPPSGHGRFGREITVLEAHWNAGVAAAEFVAGRNEDEAEFLAETKAVVEGRIAIFRFAEAKAPARLFSIDDALTSARVAPPAPFGGAGEYRAAPDGTKAWTGTLFVNFPGAPGFPLAGPPFEAAVKTVPLDPTSFGLSSQPTLAPDPVARLAQRW